MTGSSGYNPNIQMLRGVAVLLVLGFHLQLAWLPWGYLGVDLFFLVSGFLMPLILPKYTPGSFMMARVRRIYPALLAAIAACFALGWLLLMPLEMDGLARSALAALGSVSEFWFAANTGYFDQAQRTHPLLHTWSLGNEFLCYGLTALLLVLSRDEAARARMALGIAAVAALAFLGFWWVQGEAINYFNPLPRIALFFLAFWVSARGWRLSLPLAGAAVLAGVVALAGLFGADLAAQVFPGPAVFLLPLVGLPVMLLRAELPLPAPVRGVLRWLGDISYSLYIWHWPIITFQMLALRNFQLNRWEQAVLAGLSLAVAAASYYLLERSAFGRRGAVLATGAAILAALALAGIATQGFAFRFPAILAPYTTQSAMQDTAPWDCPLQVEGLAMRTSCEPIRAGEEVVIFVGDSHSRHFMHLFARAEPDTRLVRFGGKMDRINASLPALQRAAHRLGARRVYIAYHLHFEDEGEVAQMLATLRDLDFAEAVILRDIPSYRFDPVVCWVRQNSPLLYRPCEFDLRGGVPRDRVTNAQPGPWQMVQASGWPARNLHDAFCDGETCTLLHEGELLYRDNNHLHERLSPAAQSWLYGRIFAADRDGPPACDDAPGC